MFKFGRHPFSEMIIYILGFIFTLHMTPVIYINSSYLSYFIGEKLVGTIFALASVVTIIGLIAIHPILKHFGNFKVFLFVVSIECIALIGLAIGTYAWLIITSLILHLVSTTLAFFNLDIFLANITDKKSTGAIRGIYMTSSNTAFVIGPLLSGFIVANNFYQIVYILGFILLIPVITMTLRYGPRFVDPHYKSPDLLKTARKIIFHNDDIHKIFSAGFILRIFYAIMVIYTPIYLHTHIGFSWPEVGLIIAIGLIPFVLFEAPLGFIADKWLGEKEILIAGFFVTAISTMVISFINVQSILIWMFIIFMTRVGASMIEMMTEAYVFKKIDISNINTLSIYRMTSPISYIIAPTLISIFLIFTDFKYIFILLGIICLLGVYFSWKLKDTN